MRYYATSRRNPTWGIKFLISNILSFCIFLNCITILVSILLLLLPSSKHASNRINDRPFTTHDYAADFGKNLQQQQNEKCDDKCCCQAGIRKEDSHRTKQGAECVNDQNGFAVAEPGCNQSIVYVLIIRHHDRLFIIGAADDGKQGVKNRDRQHDDRNDEAEQSNVFEQSYNGNYCNHIAEKIRSGIAHVNFCRIKIVIQKAEIGAN